MNPQSRNSSFFISKENKIRNFLPNLNQTKTSFLLLKKSLELDLILIVPALRMINFITKASQTS
jgi:hypothetical protein